MKLDEILNSELSVKGALDYGSAHPWVLLGIYIAISAYVGLRICRRVNKADFAKATEQGKDYKWTSGDTAATLFFGAILGVIWVPFYWIGCFFIGLWKLLMLASPVGNLVQRGLDSVLDLKGTRLK